MLVNVQIKSSTDGGACIKHGTKVKLCSYKRCRNITVKGGLFSKYVVQLKLKICINEGCFIMYFDDEDALDGEEACCSIDRTSLTQNDDSSKIKAVHNSNE